MLTEAVRQFWFNNEPGTFKLRGEQITRQQIQAYGGPIPRLDGCPTCQELEWLSRVKQRDLYTPHGCEDKGPREKCPPGHGILWSARELCRKQGDDDWTQLHQNFQFTESCDPSLDAPRCVALFSQRGVMGTRWSRQSCNSQLAINTRRRFAQAFQLEVVDGAGPVDWSRYDLAFIYNEGLEVPNFDIPIPLLMFGMDVWYSLKLNQEMLKYYEPEHFLTPYPSTWKALHEFPAHTEFHFFPLSGSQFYTRTNLSEKTLDLMAVGNDRGHTYGPRLRLHNQIEALQGFRTEISNKIGCFQSIWDMTTGGYAHDDTHYYLNRWSEHIGDARYVIFGPLMESRAPQPVLAKHWECLASGAIPIMPDSPDFSYMGIEPMVHYIPVETVVDDNTKLAYYLQNYEEHKYIAENAVAWHEQNADRMMFDDFEAVVREITGHQYPPREVVQTKKEDR